MNKSAKWLAMVPALAVALAGCSNGGNDGSASGGASASASGSAPAGGSGKKVEISFINGFTGGDGAYMKKITDGFNASQNQYAVKELQEKDYLTKFKSGSYDLVVIGSNSLQTYKEDGLIQDVGPVMTQAGIQESDFHQAGINAVKFDGKMYALPLDIHPLTMFYNKDLTATPPATYADLQALQSKLQSGGSNTYALGIPSAGLVEFYMMTIAGQDGIDLKGDGYLNFDQPALADSLLKFNQMIYKDKVSPAGLGLDGEFQSFMKEAKDSNASVQTAVALTGPWFYGAAKEKYGDKLGVASVPQLGAKPGTYGEAHTIALPAKVKDADKLAAIAAFLKYMYTPENLIHWAESGQAPLHKATIDLIAQNKDQYPLPYANIQQFDTYIQAPSVYQFGEQMRYMNETVFSKIVSTENISKDEVTKLLKEATDKAKQIAETQP